MPKDVEIAESLVALLEQSRRASAFLRAACAIFYSHNERQEQESDSGTEIRILTGTMEHERAAREYWHEVVTLQMKIFGSAITTGLDSTEHYKNVSGWLSFVDDVIDRVKTLKPTGKPAVRIFAQERYDRNMLRENQRFSTTYFIQYSVT